MRLLKKKKRKKKKKNIVVVDDLIVKKTNATNTTEQQKVPERLSNCQLSVIKTNINNVIREPSVLIKLNDAIKTINKIVAHTYQFLKLYLLKLYESDIVFPKIDDSFIRLIIITICDSGSGRPSKNTDNTVKKHINEFFNKYYKPTMCDDPPNSKNLSYIIKYEIIDIIKNIKNNITEHFIFHFNRFINCKLKVKKHIKMIEHTKISSEEKKKLKEEYWNEIKCVKNDILRTNGELISEKKYHKWIKLQQKKFITKPAYAKNNILYDIQVNPLDYIKQMIYINNELENMGEKKLFHPIPLRTNIIPQDVTLETGSLIDILCTKNKRNLIHNRKKNQKMIWDKYFKTDGKDFNRKGYKFGYMIKTNGVSCSLIFAKIGTDGNPIKTTKHKKSEYNDSYIEETKITNEISTKKYVVIDPNYGDIIYCMSKDEATSVHELLKDEIHKKKRNEIFFRYTQNQRRVETKKKKYIRIRKSIKNENKINGKSVSEIENELSNYNSKACKFENFYKYVLKKNKINSMLFDHYSQIIYRKLQFNSYINTKKSETRMLQNFKKTFGSPDEYIVIIGDFDKKDNMKGKEPTINRRIRKLFREYGYKTFKINEFNTSKLCNNCEGEVSTFHYRESHNPKHGGKQIKVWGLVRCSNVKCGLIMNRDKNACQNMHKIVKSVLAGNGRPHVYCGKNYNHHVEYTRDRTKSIQNSQSFKNGCEITLDFG